jgi:DNA-directed RNA polymerase I, II, and III subunit RPABC2
MADEDYDPSEYDSESEEVEDEPEDILGEDEEEEEEEVEKREEEEEEGDEEEEDIADYYESTVVPIQEAKDTKPFMTTLEEITSEDTANRRTLPILNKYEKAKIIGVRAQQIAMGSHIFLDSLNGLSNPLDIAREELRQKRTPLIVRRTLVGKHTVIEDWLVENLVDPFADL